MSGTVHVVNAGLQATGAVAPAQFDIVVGRTGLESIRADWTRITQKLDRLCFCHAFEWHESYLRTLAQRDATMYFCEKAMRPERIDIVKTLWIN